MVVQSFIVIIFGEIVNNNNKEIKWTCTNSGVLKRNVDSDHFQDVKVQNHLKAWWKCMLGEQSVKCSPEVHSKASYSTALWQVSLWFGFLSVIPSCVYIETIAASWSPISDFILRTISIPIYHYQWQVSPQGTHITSSKFTASQKPFLKNLMLSVLS